MAAGDGLVSITPSSVTVGSGTATIESNGGVTLASANVVSINGVFSSAYDNYLIVFAPVTIPSGYSDYSVRWRVAGVDASGSDYSSQVFGSDSTSVGGARFLSQTSGVLGSAETNQTGDTIMVYGPALTETTTTRSLDSNGDPRVQDWISGHNVATAYDGFTLTNQTFTGTIHVFGFEE